MARDRCLLLLAKEPRPGLAKTRLAADVGAARALELAHAFVADVVANSRRVEAAERTLWFAPADAEDYFRRLDPTVRLAAQPEGDLGARMAYAFERAFGEGSERAVLVGADSPQLPAARIDEAFDALGRADVVAGPSHDGGYHLIGLRRGVPFATLFEGIPWGGPAVLDATLRAAEGLCVATLPPELDVDDGADLDELARLLAERPGVAPRTRALLGL